MSYYSEVSLTLKKADALELIRKAKEHESDAHSLIAEAQIVDQITMSPSIGIGSSGTIHFLQYGSSIIAVTMWTTIVLNVLAKIAETSKLIGAAITVIYVSCQKCISLLMSSPANRYTLMIFGRNRK